MKTTPLQKRIQKRYTRNKSKAVAKWKDEQSFLDSLCTESTIDYSQTNWREKEKMHYYKTNARMF
jgi:hypothetical protein